MVVHSRIVGCLSGCGIARHADFSMCEYARLGGLFQMNDLSVARTNMVNSQVATNKVTDKRVLGAMLDTPREIFLPASRKAAAYIDQDVVINEASEDGPARYLMQPMVFARLVQAAEITRSNDVLDIGCGTGYSSAIISRLAHFVIALESHASLADMAAAKLSELGADNAVVITGPLAKGYAGEGPYDVIVLEGAVDFVPDVLFEQLKDGGRLVAILDDGGIGRACVFTKAGASISKRVLFDANIKPLPGFGSGPEFVL